MNEMRREATLYLDDLAVGARFRSGEFVLDEAGLKAFAAQFDPSPFTWTTRRPGRPCSAGWPPAAGIPRPSPCACWSPAACRWPTG
ncbi:hypothetical protein ACFSHR_06360 [Azotobacter chroococcum]